MSLFSLVAPKLTLAELAELVELETFDRQQLFDATLEYSMSLPAGERAQFLGNALRVILNLP